MSKTVYPDKNLSLDANGNLLIDGNLPDKKDKMYKFAQKLLRYPKKSVLFPYPINFSVKQLQEALLEYINKKVSSNINFTWHLNTVVDFIDLNNCKLILSDDQLINFNILVNCEGDRRETLSKINDALTLNHHNKKFELQQISDEPTYHMAIKMRVKISESEDVTQLLEKERLSYSTNTAIQRKVKDFLSTNVMIEDDKMQIKELPFIFDPNTHKEKLPIKDWVPKFFVAGAIPKDIHEIQNYNSKRQVITKWAAFLLADRFKMSPDIFELDEKDTKNLNKTVALTFIENLMMVLDPIIKLPNNGIIITIGDAALSPIYWRGISSTLGLAQAISASKCTMNYMEKNSFDDLRNVYDKHKNLIVNYFSEISEENKTSSPEKKL